MNTEDWKKKLSESRYDIVLEKNYGPDQQLEDVRKRLLNLIDTFEESFGTGQEVEIFSGPGRTELAGNHTDHQLGRVLCASVSLDILGAVSANDERRIRILSQGYDPVLLDLDQNLSGQVQTGSSASLIVGILEYLEQGGYRTDGFDAVFHSRIPAGSGLSSSAAYEILVGQILNHLYNEDRIDPITLARAGQYAEHTYFGKPCGLMDQLGSVLGGAAAIDFRDPENIRISTFNLDPEQSGLRLCIVNTGSSHADLSEEYASIPREMKQVASFFGQEVLSQVSPEQLERNLPALRREYGDRAVLRALHFLQENERVLAQQENLASKDMEAYLKQVSASGQSSLQLLQNIWPSQDPRDQSLNLALVLAQRILDGQGAVRVHGGGFGGTIQAYVPEELMKSFIEKMEQVFGEGSCLVIKIRPDGGGVLIGKEE